MVKDSRCQPLPWKRHVGAASRDLNDIYINAEICNIAVNDDSADVRIKKRIYL
jgi:hypothetical protein